MTKAERRENRMKRRALGAMAPKNINGLEKSLPACDTKNSALAGDIALAVAVLHQPDKLIRQSIRKYLQVRWGFPDLPPVPTSAAALRLAGLMRGTEPGNLPLTCKGNPRITAFHAHEGEFRWERTYEEQGHWWAEFCCGNCEEKFSVPRMNDQPPERGNKEL